MEKADALGTVRRIGGGNRSLDHRSRRVGGKFSGFFVRDDFLARRQRTSARNAHAVVLQHWRAQSPRRYVNGGFHWHGFGGSVFSGKTVSSNKVVVRGSVAIWGTVVSGGSVGTVVSFTGLFALSTSTLGTYFK